MPSLPQILKVTLFSTPLLLAACGSDDPVVSGSTVSSSTQGAGGEGGGAGGTGGEGGTVGTGGTGGEGGAGGSGGSAAVGEPIEAPEEQWTWVPFDDAFCANGSPTGIGVNLTKKSKKVAIFLMGGGACWDNLTCYQLKTASNLSGYGAQSFDADAKGFLASSLFDRDDADNPTKDYSFVFVPYCTGDVHSGDKEAEYGGKKTMHVGFANMTAYLKRIVATFPDAERVLLTGSSAGGFGAGTNYWRVQEAFGSIRVDMVDDSGPALPSPYLSEEREATWRAAWNLDAALPPDCPDCKTKLDALIPYYAAKFPKNRCALLSYTKDNVISQFYGPIATSYFEEGLKKVTEEQLEALPNFRYYYLPGQSHVLLSNPNNTSMSGVVLKDWLTQMLTDDADWKSVNPWN